MLKLLISGINSGRDFKHLFDITVLITVSYYVVESIINYISNTIDSIILKLPFKLRLILLCLNS